MVDSARVFDRGRKRTRSRSSWRVARRVAGALGVSLLLMLGGLSEAQERAPESPAEVDDFLGDIASDDDDLFGDEDLGDDGDPFADDSSEATSDEDGEADQDTTPTDLGDESEPGATVPGAFDELSAEAATPSSDVEEILVTGEASVGVLPDESVSVTAFDSDDLLALGVENIADVAQYTPNLEIRTVGSSTATFFIRGVGLNDFTANASGSVAIYVDESPLNLPAIQLGQLFDVEKVEVLKGPQGSGPGRNASAGAIRIFTRKPTGEYSAFARVDYGNYNYVDAEGTLEVPLLADVLSSRVAFRFTRRDGIVDNGCGGLSPAEAVGSVCGNLQTTTIRPHLEEDLNDLGTWAARTTFRYQPEGLDIEWLVSGHVAQIDQLGPVGEHLGARSQILGSADNATYSSPEIRRELAGITAKLNPPTRIECVRMPPGPGRDECFDKIAQPQRILSRRVAERPLDRRPYDGEYNNPGHERLTNLGGQVRTEWEHSVATVTSVTGYEHYDRERLIDADYSPNQLFEFDFNDDAWQFTQDLRVEGELESEPISWGAGAFYLMQKLEFDQETLALPGGPVRPLFQGYEQGTWGFGIYGEVEWELLDDFTLLAGLRYNWERQSFNANIIQGNFDVCSAADVDCSDEVKADHPTGTVSLTYHFDDDRSVYWKYSHGWKAAQFNVRDGNSTTAIDIASPEEINAFEFGFSSAWFDGRLSISGALFWYLYQNYQVFTFTNDFGSPAQRIVLNANDAQLHGAELESRLEPLDGLELTARAGWLESTFLDFSDTGARPSGIPNVVVQDVFDFNGNRLPNTPRFKVSASASYALELGRFGTVIPRWDVSWTDEIFFNQTNGRGVPGANVTMPNRTIGQQPYWLHNARLTYRVPSGNIEVSGWVRNVTDELYKTLSFDASAGPGLVGNLVGDPRTYGLSVSLSF